MYKRFLIAFIVLLSIVAGCDAFFGWYMPDVPVDVIEDTNG